MKGRKESKMKKTLAILLSLALVVCMIPATASVAFAAENVWGSGTIETFGPALTTTYDGTNQIPNLSFQYKPSEGDAVDLVKGTDYNIEWKDSSSNVVTSAINAGTYTATIKGINTHNGSTHNVTFTINKLDLDAISDAELYVPALTTADTSASIVQKTTFKDVSGANLTGDINAVIGTIIDGKANITFTATSSGNVSVTTSKVKKDVAVSQGLSSVVINGGNAFNYTGDVIEPKDVTVKAKSDASTEVTVDDSKKYTIGYSDNVNVGYGKVKATAVSNSGYTGSAETTFRINPISASDAESKGILKAADITAKQIKNKIPKVTVYQKIKGSWVVVPESCYTVTATGNDKAGTATARITFNENSNYTKDTYIEKKFTVVDSTNDISTKITNDQVTVSGNTVTYTYNGTVQKPTVTVNVSSTIVKPGTDYVIKFEDAAGVRTEKPIAAGTYKIVIEGIGSYAGEVMTTKTFTINKLDLSEKNASNVTAVFSGTTSDPVTVKVNGNTLKRYTDYNVDSYNSSKTLYTVTGTGSCYGTRIVYVSTRSISSCTINFSDNRSSVAYGSTYYPDVTVYYGSTRLKKDTDYTVTYKNSKNQTVSYCRDTGTYSVIVTGIGAYTGTKTLYFTITGTDISNYTVTLKESSVTATGYSQTPVITSVKYGYYSSLSSNDYTVSYQDAAGKTVYSMSAPGTYKVVVTGKNGYSGSTYATFRIVGLPQTVTVNQDSYKVYDDSDAFKITAKATGDGTGFTYTSSNPTVASVSYTGVVTPNKVGRAVITVTTTGNKKYEPTSKQVIVKVYPDKAKLSKKPWTDGKAGRLKVRWGYQDGVTKYQIRYSRDKNFKSGTYLTKTVKAHGKDYTTQSTTLTNLKRGYTYYVKVRAVYTDPVTGDNYYGSWSGWRSAKTI